VTDETNGTDEPQPEQPEVAQPTIIITFAEHLSADCRMTVTDCSPFQMWGAARMLEQYAQDQWQAAQMQQAMIEAQRRQEEASKIVPVRGGIKGAPLDHLRRRGN
jgi:hypothetical protein